MKVTIQKWQSVSEKGVALQYLHEQDVCHRDLKLENIFLADETDLTMVKVRPAAQMRANKLMKLLAFLFLYPVAFSAAVILALFA